MTEPRPLRDVSEPPHEGVIDALERMLVLACSGELRGVVILGNTPGSSAYEQAGTWDGPSILWALETWKHRFLHGAQELL